MRILLVVLMVIADPAQAPWFGTWKLHPATSAANSDRFKRVTFRIEPAEEGLKVIYDMVGSRGGITHMEWNGKFDGKDYPVEGVDYVLTNAYMRVNDHSYQISIKVDGALAATKLAHKSSTSSSLRLRKKASAMIAVLS